MKTRGLNSFLRNASPVEWIAVAALCAVMLYSLDALVFSKNAHNQGRGVEQFGVISTWQGDVQMRRAGSFVWQNVAQNDVIFEGDTVRTGRLSEAAVEAEGVQKLLISANALVVFRRGTKGHAFEIKAGSVQRTDAASPVEVAAAKPAPRVQKLRWVAPVQSQLVIAPGQDPVTLAWHANVDEKLMLEITRNDEAPTRLEVGGDRWSLPAKVGRYALRLSSKRDPRVSITRSLTLSPQKIPRWNEIQTLSTGGLALSWTIEGEAPTRADVKIVRAGRQLVFTPTSALAYRLPEATSKDIQGSAEPAIAFVRTTTNDRTSPWSDPLVLPSSVKTLGRIEGRFERTRTWLTYPLRGGAPECTSRLAWQSSNANWKTKVIFVRRGNDTVETTSALVGNAFCLPAPGTYRARTLGFTTSESGENLLAATGEWTEIQADLSAPQFTATAWRRDLQNALQPSLVRPAPYPLEIEWFDAKNAVVGSSNRVATTEWLTPPAKAHSARLRWIDREGAPLSAWSGLATKPVVDDLARTSRSLASVSGEALALDLHLRRSGPLFVSDWHPTSFAEIAWEPLVHAAWYEIETSYVADFTSNVTKKAIRANKMILSVVDNRPVYWRARAYAAPGEIGPWTPTQVVKIQAINSDDPAVATRSSPEIHRRERLDRPSVLQSPPTRIGREPKLPLQPRP